MGLDSATQNEVSALTTLETTRTATIGEMGAARARADQMREVLGRTDASIVASTQITRNPQIEGLQTKVTELTVTRAGLLKDYAPTSLKIKEVDAQIEQLQQQQKTLVRDILTSKQVAVNPAYTTFLNNLVEAEGQALSSSAKIAGLEQSIAERKSALRRLPEQQFRMAQLERDVQIAEKTYLVLQDRYQSMRIAEESTLATVQVIEPAVLPTSPVSPRPMRNLILGLLLGTMVGIGLAALQESLDDSLRTPEDVEKEVGLPLLGIIPHIPEPEERSLLHTGTLSGTAEAYRMLRSNIKFLSVDRAPKTLMVTSAGKGEGKSTTAANLAIALAQDAKKVALVDGDLRRPSVHRQIGIPNNAGLTNAIVSGAPLADVTLDIGIENLSVITAGPIPPNPAELLDSARFSRIMEELRTIYDIVVFDAPPVLGVADASVLGGKVDGVVLVLASGEVERRAARRVVQMLAQARANVLGVMLNKIQERHGGYYYYYYNYYYQQYGGEGERRKSSRGTGNGNGNGNGTGMETVTEAPNPQGSAWRRGGDN